MDSYADLLNLNFMYSLRTGHLLTDMMIAALLPLVSGAVAYVTRTWWPQLVNRLLAYFSNVDCTSASFRTSEERPSIYYGFTLRVALSTYVTKVLQPRFDVAELKYLCIPGKKVHEAASYTEALRDYCFVDAGPAKELPMELTRDLELKQADTGESNEGNGKEGEGGEGGGGKAGKESRDTIFTLVQYRHSFPALKRLVGLQSEDKVVATGAEVPKEVAELEERTSTNGDAIQLLLDRALAHYRTEFTQAGKSTDRYLYQPLLTRPKLGFGVTAADDKTGAEGAMDCNRYLLRSEKTFNSLFFPDKARLLQLIDNFESKSGKYAIPGYPQKLVLLLYGPPGTGKTSLAKAVAAYTQRDLFAISLSRIRSNEELLRYMFSGHVKVKNEKKNDDNHYRYNNNDDGPKELDPTKLVYILEDVDATSAVVLKDEEEEEGEEGSSHHHHHHHQLEKKKGESGSVSAKGSSVRSASQADIESETKDDVAEEDEEEEKEAGASNKGSAKEGETEDAEEGEENSNSTEHEVVAVKEKGVKRTRRLTIEGLTNALNGVLDFPQRIVIMTTNHIEKLHPSLLRPGVVTMKLHMHNFDAACAVAMVSHYFSHTQILPDQLEQLRQLVEKASATSSKADTTAGSTHDNTGAAAKGFSPAELEQRCAECETIDELLEALRQGSRVNTF